MRHEQGFGEIELDRCKECDALWFDGGELARWSAARGRQPDVPVAATHAAANASGDAATPAPTTAAVATPANCPACAEPTLKWRDWLGARLGGCGRCHGLYVPPELQQRLDRPRPPEPPGPPRPPPIEPPRDVPTWGQIGAYLFLGFDATRVGSSFWNVVRRLGRGGS